MSPDEDKRNGRQGDDSREIDSREIPITKCVAPGQIPWNVMSPFRNSTTQRTTAEKLTILKSYTTPIYI